MAVRRQSRSKSMQQLGRLREGEQLLHGVEGDAAQRPGQGLVADDLAVGQAHDGMEDRAHAALEDQAATARRGAPPRRPRARPGSSSIASVTACWMARSLRTMGSFVDARVAGGEAQDAQQAAVGQRLDALRAAPLTTRSRRAAALRPRRRRPRP